MARTLKLYSFTGILPHGFERPDDKRHVVQCSCWVAAYSNAEFMRITNSGRAFLAYANISERVPDNEGARLAAANPGVVYMNDDFNHAAREDVWIVHPKNGNP